MCGIAGIVGPAAGQHRASLDAMVRALAHRGPDGRGETSFPDCLLGHTRLSVIDVERGVQPMHTPDGHTAVVFNGEIYGYRTLRSALRPDYPFRTESDTEVLLALHVRHRHQMLDHLSGMFAFAIWDDRRRELFCARDRFGEKPFFWAWAEDGSFVFASEIKGILASGLVTPEIDRGSLEHYLRHLYVHPHRTIYRNVHVLPPAHRLCWRDGRVDVAAYWAPPPVEPGISARDATERFRALLDRAVRRQLVADVPVGLFLSGGLDSSTIVALAARAHGGPRTRTFAFGFGRVIDERPYARGIAERYGTLHTELSDEDADLPALLERMAQVYDDPFADSSNIPTYLLCRHARRHVTVVLTGEGSDELLGGYTYWYRALHEMERAADRGAAMHAVGGVIGAICRRTRMPAPAWAAPSTSGRAWRRQFRTVGAAHAARTAVMGPADLSRLVPGSGELADERDGIESLDGVLRSDLATYLPGDILVKTDRASMAHGLELRAPFLDAELASFCLSLPARLKVTDASDKVVLRRAFARAWTPEVRRRPKQGFGAPVREWLRRPDVDALRRDLLGNARSAVFDLVDFRAVQELAATGDYRAWALLVLAVWAASRRPTRPAAAGAVLAPNVTGAVRP